MKKLLAFLVAALMLCCVGCGSKPATDPTDGIAADEPVEIVFWNVFADDSDTGVFLSQVAEKFMAENENIKVTIVGQGGYDAIVERLEAAAASNTLPTMAIIEETFLGRFYPLTVDLSQYLSAETIANYQQGLLVSGYYDGVLRAVPFNRSMPNLYINRTLFDEAGITDVPTTWEEYFATAEKLTNKDKGVYGAGICWDTDAWIFESILYSHGGDIISEDNTKIVLNDTTVAADIVTEYQKYIDEGVVFNPYIYQDNVWSTIGSAFLEGKLAMFLGSNGVYSMYNQWMKDAGYEMEIHQHPDAANGIATGAGNIVVFSNATEAQRQAAAKFMTYLASDENAAAYTVLSGYLPTTGFLRQRSRAADLPAGEPLLPERHRPDAVCPPPSPDQGLEEHLHRSDRRAGLLHDLHGYGRLRLHCEGGRAGPDHAGRGLSRPRFDKRALNRVWGAFRAPYPVQRG